MTTAPETLVPKTAEEAAAAIDAAAVAGHKVRFRGGGTHRDLGHPVAADVALSTAGLEGVVDWSPDDLTVVVGAGTRVADLEAELGTRGQSAVLPEVPGDATVGGVVAAGASGWRRLYYGPTRDRLLEVVLATGDGRVVRGGGRVVKNVTGYDLPRLLTGSLGSLGLIVQVALKLWPRPAAAATVTVDDPEAALAAAFRPLAVIEALEGTRALLAGTPEEVDAQSEALSGTVVVGHRWPEPLPHPVVVSLRVPPGETEAAVARLPSSVPRQAGHGVGQVLAGWPGDALDDLTALRRWAERRGGSLVVVRGSEEVRRTVDPWGTPPRSTALQRRVKAAFDPLGVCNPGILPGGI